MDGLVVAGAIPVIWIAISTTLGEAVIFTFPIYARFLKRFSPDWILVLEDLAEALFALLAVLVMAAFPNLDLWPFLAYLLVLMFLTHISDIADEFYGAKLAQVDEKAALAYNASISAFLSIAGFVVAVPLGSIIASQSAAAVLLVNVVLSLVGAATRLSVSRAVHVWRAFNKI